MGFSVIRDNPAESGFHVVREDKPKSFWQQRWENLGVWEPLAKEGLTKIADSIPEQSDVARESARSLIPQPLQAALPAIISKMPQPIQNAAENVGDIVGGAPKVMAETAAEVAPGFVSRGSIATAGVAGALGVAKPVINAVGNFVGRGAEALSGLTYENPGVLSRAASDPLLFFRGGIAKARELYDQVGNPSIREELKQFATKGEFVQKVLDLKDPTPYETLEARKSLDFIKKTLPDVVYHSLRDKLNEVAKTVYASADAAYKTGADADALRTVFPLNKTGTPSIAKMVLGGIAVPAGIAMSPAAQGLSASLVGGAAKAISPFANNPILGEALPAISEEIMRMYRSRNVRK